MLLAPRRAAWRLDSKVEIGLPASASCAVRFGREGFGAKFTVLGNQSTASWIALLLDNAIKWSGTP